MKESQDHRPGAVEEDLAIGEAYYILATSALVDDRTRVLKHGDSFAVFDRYGDIRRAGIGEQGIYHEGTRFLSHLDLRIENKRPLLLGSNILQDNERLVIDATNPDFYDGHGTLVPRGTVHMRRLKSLGKAGAFDQVRISNYGGHTVKINLTVQVGSDFHDVFEVRGVKRERRGETLPVLRDAESIVHSYRGLDDVMRRLRVMPTPAAQEVQGSTMLFTFELPPHGACSLELDFSFETESRTRTRPHAALPSTDAWKACEVISSNEPFNRWLRRSLSDFRMMITRTEQGDFPYAGIPWFCAPFGRDGIVSALETLWIAPEIARDVLVFLASTQAQEEDPRRDAEPGKIFHEMRKGEMAALGEIPFGLYYGSVDATPLFIHLAAAYYERTGDRVLLGSLWDPIEKALRWIDDYGDIDGDGFVEYLRRTEAGLLHQGWKDSHDAVFHADGTLAEPPIALCEVQAYVYAAKRGASQIAAALGLAERAAELARQAEALKARFQPAFWDEEMGLYVLALDARKRPCQVGASNAGQCLFSGIAGEEQAFRIAATLLDEDFFSGWGIRTVSAKAPRYNPMSYHNGSIWPHDNALIAYGLSHYGMQSSAMKILEALFQSSLHLESYRLPELLCGFPRREGQGPTLYPVACSPQSWAAGSAFLLLQASLGLRIEAARSRLSFHDPHLPEGIDSLTIRRLSVGEGSIDLTFQRLDDDVAVHVLKRTGDIDVVVMK